VGQSLIGDAQSLFRVWTAVHNHAGPIVATAIGLDTTYDA
jgi:hypothetical protein